MTKLFRTLAGAALLALASPAFAGVPISDIPSYAKGNYGQLPDGTWAPMQIGPNGATSPYTFTKLGCGQITSLGSAATFGSVPAGATLVSLSVEGQPVRMRDDGTNPTASVGLLLPVGGPWPYQADLSAIRFIQTASSATISYCFYK